MPAVRSHKDGPRSDSGPHGRAPPLKPAPLPPPSSVNLLLYQLLHARALEGCAAPCVRINQCHLMVGPSPPRERQHHNPLLHSLQLQLMLSDSLSLSFQGLHPQPTPPSIPASQPHSSSPGTSAELGRCRSRLQVLVSAEAGKPTPQGSPPGTCQNTAFECQTGATPGGGELRRAAKASGHTANSVSCKQTRVRYI